jgi:5-amino-6-(5-phospho-D-ribitylamino)uracil phosphatase
MQVVIAQRLPAIAIFHEKFGFMEITNIPPQDIRLLTIDIDGTLLNPQKHITPRTRTAIQAAQQQGIIVTLATARRYINTAPIAQELGITIPVILCDGALIIEHPDGNVLHRQVIGATVAQQAVEILVQHGVQPVVHHINGMIEEIWTGLSEYDNEWVTEYFATFPANMQRLPYVSCCTGQPDPLRVVAFTSEEIVHRLIPEISLLDCAWNMTRRGSYGTAELTIMHATCSKASGVQTLARQLAIPLEQVMAIGDNNNDIEMLQSVGWGVAMGQASDNVKAIADAVTTSNAEDGVALAIERYALRASSHALSNSFNRATCL